MVQQKTMNTQFENRYLTTDNMLSEYIRRVLLVEQLSITTATSILLGGFLFLALYCGMYVLSVMSGCIMLTQLSVVIFSPRRVLRQMKERTSSINNGQKCESVVKFGDNISISEGTFSMTVEYSQILKIHHLKYLYVLMFGKHNAIILDLTGFTIGSFEDFQTFIKQKMSLLK